MFRWILLFLALLFYTSVVHSAAFVDAKFNTDKTKLIFEYDDKTVQLLCLPEHLSTPSSFDISADHKSIAIQYSDNSEIVYCMPQGLPPTAKVFEESAGKVVIPAKDFSLSASSVTHQWVLIDNSFLRAEPNTATAEDRVEDTSGPSAAYLVNFTQAGDYFVWIKGAGVSGEDDSVHFGINNQISGTMDFFGMSALGFTNLTRDGVPAKITIADPGVHSFYVWMREDGFFFDEIQISKDPNYRP